MKTRRRPGTVVLTALTIIAAAVAANIQPASAITLFSFRGTVTDALGRPLAGATVTDGINQTTTASDGTYALSESSTGTYTLEALRADTNTAQQTVTVLVPVESTFNPLNFGLLYKITGQLSSSYLSTASASASATLNITSFVPSPNSSCVSVTDSRTNAITPASLSATNADGSSTWAYGLSVLQNTPEARYSLAFKASDCGTGTVLSVPNSVDYTVDNTAPRIDPASFVPSDFGNTIFGSATLGNQPLAVKVTDAGSGLTPSSVSFALTDTTTASTVNVAATYNSGTKWAKSAPVALVLGHVYRLTASATDRATNASSVAQHTAAAGGGFLATALDVANSATNATIPATACSVSSGSTLATKTVTCTGVPLAFDATQVSMAGSRHGPDPGYVDETVSLAGAYLTTASLPGVKYYPSQTGTTWPPQTKSMRFDTTAPFVGTQLFAVPSRAVPITDTLKVEVPAAWGSDATLQMDLTGTTAAMPGYCADPTTSAPATPCTPDPLANRYVVSLSEATHDPLTVGLGQMQNAGGDLTVPFNASEGYLAAIPYGSLSGVAHASGVSGVARNNYTWAAPGTSAVCTGGDFGQPSIGDWFRDQGTYATLSAADQVLTDHTFPGSTCWDGGFTFAAAGGPAPAPIAGPLPANGGSKSSTSKFGECDPPPSFPTPATPGCITAQSTWSSRLDPGSFHYEVNVIVEAELYVAGMQALWSGTTSRFESTSCGTFSSLVSGLAGPIRRANHWGYAVVGHASADCAYAPYADSVNRFETEATHVGLRSNVQYQPPTGSGGPPSQAYCWSSDFRGRDGALLGGGWCDTP